MSGFIEYGKEKRKLLAAGLGVWLFLDLYLGGICASHLYPEDILYLNLLLLLAAGVGIYSDYRKWSTLRTYLMESQRKYSETSSESQREHLAASQESQREHLAASPESQGEHLAASPGSRGEYSTASLGSRGEYSAASSGEQREYAPASPGKEGKCLKILPEFRGKFQGQPLDLSEEQEAALLGCQVAAYLRREREYQEQEKRKLLREQEEMADYIARWSHEAKLPLASLRLMNERNRDAELKREMQGCIVRLETLIHTVMMGSKLQRPEHDVKYERISLEDAVGEAVKNHSYYLIHDKFQIERELGGLSVYSDRRWLVYLLDQLVGNAVKYKKETPCLSFRARRTDQGSVCLVVEDHGIGIAEEELPFIFERGYVGKNLRKGDYRSTGMGLHFVKHIGELLHISIKVFSREGEGCRFELYFSDLTDHFLMNETITEM